MVGISSVVVYGVVWSLHRSVCLPPLEIGLSRTLLWYYYVGFLYFFLLPRVQLWPELRILCLYFSYLWFGLRLYVCNKGLLELRTEIFLLEYFFARGQTSPRGPSLLNIIVLGSRTPVNTDMGGLRVQNRPFLVLRYKVGKFLVEGSGFAELPTAFPLLEGRSGVIIFGILWERWRMLIGILSFNAK